jgi:sec-independent protein translocase protein TatA
MGSLFDRPSVLIIALIAVIVIFGSKRLPDAARGVGRSLRILKAETKGLMTDDEGQAVPPAQQPQQVAPPAVQPVAPAPAPQPAPADPVAQTPPPAAPAPAPAPAPEAPAPAAPAPEAGQHQS